MSLQVQPARRARARSTAARFASSIAVALWSLPVLAADAIPGKSRPAVERLASMSLEDLSQLQVTSVSKTPEPVQGAPASIYVITHDDIVRSGAVHIVDVLRLAPNLQVRQINNSRFEVTARGFGGALGAQNFSNKLLMLIDGRSVYTPLFSGIYHDVQDVLLDDIDRIEIISGPGATLWGPNAMNGVINVITRSADLAHEPMLKAAAGNMERTVAGRYGGRWHGRTGAWRVYGKFLERDALELQNGQSAENDWHKTQVGFRTDWSHGDDQLTVQGDSYRARLDESGQPNQMVMGHNVLGRWQRPSGRSLWQVQAYYDYTKRSQPVGGAAFHLHTVDLELQQQLNLERHRWVWGAGWRLHRYEVTDGAGLLIDPNERDANIGNVFAQDTYELTSTLSLTAGLKVEKTDRDGWVPMPELRLAWQAGPRHLLWAGAARAIRASTPFDRDVIERIDDLVFLVGNKDSDPEKVDTIELGWRAQPHPGVSVAAAVFLNYYDDLRTIEPAPDGAFLPLRWDNLMEGKSYGAEAWAKWQVTSTWRLSPGVRVLQKDLRWKDDASELLGFEQAANDPERQLLLTSSLDLGHAVTFDATLRYVSQLPDPRLDERYQFSASIGWQVTPGLDVSLTGANLSDPRHEEYPTADGGQVIDRSFIAQVRWRL
jgi:iron complex outermembrane receptor protein